MSIPATKNTEQTMTKMGSERPAVQVVVKHCQLHHVHCAWLYYANTACLRLATKCAV